jgi:hypothetical protein
MWHLNFESRDARDLLGESHAHDRVEVSRERARVAPRRADRATTTPVMADSMRRRAHASIGAMVTARIRRDHARAIRTESDQDAWIGFTECDRALVAG